MDRPPYQVRAHLFAQRRGFNLIEAAVVLGVIGLVIGGIWVAAAAVRAENRRLELRNSLLQISSKVMEFPYQEPVLLWLNKDVLEKLGVNVVDSVGLPLQAAARSRGGAVLTFEPLNLVYKSECIELGRAVLSIKGGYLQLDWDNVFGDPIQTGAASLQEIDALCSVTSSNMLLWVHLPVL